jgi:hypothetical protein
LCRVLFILGANSWRTPAARRLGWRFVSKRIGSRYRTRKGEQFIGVDSGGVNYDGTAKEQEDGSIVLDVKLVPPEVETAQSRASEGLPHTRHFFTTLSPAFGDGKPQEISSAPGNVMVMIRQVRDDFLHPDVRPTLFDTHRLGAASDVYLKGHSGREDR